MDPQQNLKQLQDLFANAKDILITTRADAGIDAIASCLALYHALSQRVTQGKAGRVVVAISGRHGSQYSLLPGSDKIYSELGLRDLVIGVNGYVDKAIENVNWYVDQGRLNVVFKSNPAVPMQFDLKNLDPFYAGANYDVVIAIGAANAADLGNLYRQDPGMFSELPVINISNDLSNSNFGRVNIVDSSVPSVSELVFQLLQILRVLVQGDMASLLLLGINDATESLQRKGSQTDQIVSQLSSVGGPQLDLQAVRNQKSQNPLPVVQPGVTGPVPPQQGQGLPYPQQQPPMPNGQMPPFYSQMAPGMYPPYYPPQPNQYPGQYPPNPYIQQPPFPPGYGMPNPYAPNPYAQGNLGGQQSFPQAPPEPQQQYQQYEESPDGTAQNNEYASDPYAVPSVHHDQIQYDSYIPTTDVSGFDHVEPSIHLPDQIQDAVPYYPEYDASSDDSNAPAQMPQTLEERKEQRTPPDWNRPPQVFTGEKSE